MTSQKHPREEEDLEDVVLCLKVEKLNQRDHVGSNLQISYDEEDPKISRRVIRAVRNELIHLINAQKLIGADVTEFEHILHRNEGTTDGASQEQTSSQSLYDRSNGRIYTQNGTPQIRCPAKGLRVLPRLDYSHRYSEKTGMPLDRTEAKSEEKLFRTPSPKKARVELKRSATRSDVDFHDVEEDMGEGTEEGINEYTGDGTEEGAEEDVGEGIEERVNEGMEESVEEDMNGHYEEDMNDDFEEDLNGHSEEDLNSHFEEGVNGHVEEGMNGHYEEGVNGSMNFRIGERMQDDEDNDLQETTTNLQKYPNLDEQESIDDPAIASLFLH